MTEREGRAWPNIAEISELFPLPRLPHIPTSWPCNVTTATLIVLLLPQIITGAQLLLRWLYNVVQVELSLSSGDTSP